jgi:hypothetical protein
MRWIGSLDQDDLTLAIAAAISAVVISLVFIRRVASRRSAEHRNASERPHATRNSSAFVGRGHF